MLAITSSCQKKGKDGVEGIAVVCVDESFQNVMKQLVPVFEFTNDKAYVAPYYLPERECVDSLINGTTDLIIIPRKLTDKEFNYLDKAKRSPRQERIAVDAVAILANKANTTDQLSLYELRKILKGEYTDWSQIDPKSTLGEISIVFDYDGSSTITYLRDKLLDGGEITGKAYAQESNAKVFDIVQKMPGAIGVVGVSYVAQDMSTANLTTEQLTRELEKESVSNTEFASEVRVMPIADDNEVYGYQPYQAYIYDGKYPLVREIYAIATGYKGSVAQAFYVFCTSFQGQKLMLTTGVVSGYIQPRIVEVN